MRALTTLLRWARRALRRHALHSLITQLQGLLARPDLAWHPDTLPRSQYEALLAALRRELHHLEQPQ